MTKKQIAIIYEGEKTERQLIESLNREFFAPISELVPIMFPAGENIYMLWQKLKEDEFETDVIEVVREYNETAKRKLEGYKRDDFMEVYLFFDYDGHQDNLKGNVEADILEEMLATFCEETELGKLYINYPMVESLRDNLPPKEERCFRRCAVRWDEMRKYKQLVGNMIDYQDFRKLSREKWGELCFNSVCRLNCLINDTYETPSREEFIEKMGQGKIYHMQKEKWISKGKVMVLNSVPLFLLEYFRGEFWDQYI